MNVGLSIEKGTAEENSTFCLPSVETSPFLPENISEAN